MLMNVDVVDIQYITNESTNCLIHLTLKFTVIK